MLRFSSIEKKTKTIFGLPISFVHFFAAHFAVKHSLDLLSSSCTYHEPRIPFLQLFFVSKTFFTLLCTLICHTCYVILNRLQKIFCAERFNGYPNILKSLLLTYLDLLNPPVNWCIVGTC